MLYLLIGDILVIIDLLMHLDIYNEYIKEVTVNYKYPLIIMILATITLWPIALIIDIYKKFPL
jgi:hypothetical protein